MISKFIYPTKFFFLVATLISCLALICVKSKMIASTIQLGGGGGGGTIPFRGNRKFHSFDGWQSNGIFPARLILVKSPLGVIHTGKHSVVYRYGNDSKRFFFLECC